MIHPHLTVEQLRAISLALEESTGFDSIPTIELHYRTSTRSPHRQDRGFGCVFPTCVHRTATATMMWKHVHFGRKHGLSFGVKWADLTA